MVRHANLNKAERARTFDRTADNTMTDESTFKCQCYVRCTHAKDVTDVGARGSKFKVHMTKQYVSSVCIMHATV